MHSGQQKHVTVVLELITMLSVSKYEWHVIVII